MRVYRAEADPSNILTLEEEHGLLQIAHRPQANAIVLRIGKQLLPRLSPLARLYLCTEYDLDGLLRRAVENERARRTRVNTPVARQRHTNSSQYAFRCIFRNLYGPRREATVSRPSMATVHDLAFTPCYRTGPVSNRAPQLT